MDTKNYAGVAGLPAILLVSCRQRPSDDHFGASDWAWAKSQITFFRLELTVKFNLVGELILHVSPNQGYSGLTGKHV
jgi:hypothetical protein